MIKLKSLIEQKLKLEIPEDPFDHLPDPYEPVSEQELDKIRSDLSWRDDDDQNMNDEEYEEFQNYLNGWLDDIRQRDLTDKIIDVDQMITEFMLMDQETRNILGDMSDEEINKISKILQQKRKNGKTCYFYKRYGIKYLGDKNKLKYDWEKDYYNKHHRK